MAARFNGWKYLWSAIICPRPPIAKGDWDKSARPPSFYITSSLSLSALLSLLDFFFFPQRTNRLWLCHANPNYCRRSFSPLHPSDSSLPGWRGKSPDFQAPHDSFLFFFFFYSGRSSWFPIFFRRNQVAPCLRNHIGHNYRYLSDR